MESQSRNIVDDLLLSNSYVILLSGLEKSPIVEVAADLLSAFGSYAIDLDFMHLPFTDKSTKIKDRLNDLVSKRKIIIVRAQNYDGNMSFENTHILRINISINSIMLGNVDLMKQYKNELLSSGVNRYFNFKEDTNMEEYKNSIYWYIIDDIERKVYGVNYKRLSHKYYSETKNVSESKEVKEQNKPAKENGGNVKNDLEFHVDDLDERFNP